MAHWLDTVIKILTADTNNLKELATIAGGDPKNFYIGTKIDGANIRGQNLKGMMFSDLDLRFVDYDSETAFDDKYVQVVQLKRKAINFRSAVDYFHYLKILESQKNINEAIALARRALNQFPENVNLWLFYIDIVIKYGDYTDALYVINEALAVHSHNISVKSRKIQLLLRNNEREVAVEMLREAIRQSPKDHSLLILAYEIHQKYETLPEILSEYENAVRVEHDPSNIVLKLGNIYKKSGMAENAERIYKTVAKNDPNNAAVWNAWSQFLFEQQRFSESVQIFSSYHINNNNVGIWKAYGDALMRIGSIEEAIHYYETLFEEKRYDFQLVKWLGEAYLKANMRDEAIALFKAATERPEARFFVWKWLFNALIEQKKYQEAIVCMTDAKKRYPKNKSIDEHLEYARNRILIDP